MAVGVLSAEGLDVIGVEEGWIGIGLGTRVMTLGYIQRGGSATAYGRIFCTRLI